MDALRTGVLSLSVFLLMSGCFTLLLPPGGMQKSFRYLQSLMVVLLVLSIIGIGVNWRAEDLRLPDGQIPKDTAESVQKSYLHAAKRSVEELVEETLKEIHLAPVKITVDGDILEDGRIHIGQIAVTLDRDNGEKVDGAYQLLKAKMGGEISVRLQEVEKDGS